MKIQKNGYVSSVVEARGMGRGTWVYSFYLKISLKISMIRSLKYLDY